MAHTFKLNSEALKREFSVYVVIASDGINYDLYVGKTGDNREGCNPLISRCGNHFSYNKIHSQVRNKIADHENKEYTYVFDHLSEYVEDLEQRKTLVDITNEMERHLNKSIATLIQGLPNCELLNPYKGIGVTKKEKARREKLHTKELDNKILTIVEKVDNIISKTSNRTK